MTRNRMHTVKGFEVCIPYFKAVDVSVAIATMTCINDDFSLIIFWCCIASCLTISSLTFGKRWDTDCMSQCKVDARLPSAKPLLLHSSGTARQRLVPDKKLILSSFLCCEPLAAFSGFWSRHVDVVSKRSSVPPRKCRDRTIPRIPNWLFEWILSFHR
jgi:hypothetical protein